MSPRSKALIHLSTSEQLVAEAGSSDRNGECQIGGLIPHESPSIIGSPECSEPGQTWRLPLLEYLLSSSTQSGCESPTSSSQIIYCRNTTATCTPLNRGLVSRPATREEPRPSACGGRDYPESGIPQTPNDHGGAEYLCDREADAVCVPCHL
ncbi:hypothetical protein SKAU_G00226270 [Synaphobranchus kaupii]|uniref:Uncharacterized protein n=1 Tax=Synaphobranchus kaupii TaxID=118154 RepID=A0A9Q1F4P9_SYNKA|nr:hypothetical protein SKAU_G00226270 [Synaphobranchus kaupii]